MELSALESLKIPSKTNNGENGVVTFSWLFLIGFFSYLQVIMTYIRV